MIVYLGDSTHEIEQETPDQLAPFLSELDQLPTLSRDDCDQFWQANQLILAELLTQIGDEELFPPECSLSPKHLHLSLQQSFESFQNVNQYPWSHKGWKTRCGIVFSGNLPLNGLATLLRLLGEGCRVLVVLSRRDVTLPSQWLKAITKAFRQLPVFMVVRDENATRQDALDLAFVDAVEHLVCYGSADTVRYWSRLGTPTTIHGAAMSFAWVDGMEIDTLPSEDIAYDVLYFGQAGCLSTQFLYLDGTYAEACEIFDKLRLAFRQVADKLDISPNSLETMPSFRMTMETMTLRERMGQVSLVIDPNHRWALSLEPISAGINWAGQGGWLRIYYGDAAEAKKSLDPLMKSVKSITIWGNAPEWLTHKPTILYPQPGKAQSPPFPWPGGSGSECG